MIFPEDPEIREFTSYAIRARKIIIEEFSKLEGRPPNEMEIQDLLRMVVVPFGILKQQNGSSHFQNFNSMKQNQENGKRDVDSVTDIVKEHSELSIEGERVVMKKKIEPVDVFYAVRDEMERRGWKYIRPKQIGGDKWEPGFFEVERARA
jgi:hypothetical protein